MHVTYDHTGDMAYISLVPIPPRSVMQTEPLVIDLRSGLRQLINLHFDVEGRLIGIEVAGARSGLPAVVIAGAERIADPK